MKNKKLLSPLFFSIVIFTIIVSTLQVAHATTYDWIINGGFETGSLPPWTTQSGTGAAYVTSDYHRTGSYSALTEGWPFYSYINQTLAEPIPWANISEPIFVWSTYCISGEADFRAAIRDTNGVWYWTGIMVAPNNWNNWAMSKGYMAGSYPALTGKSIDAISLYNTEPVALYYIAFDDVHLYSDLVPPSTPTPYIPSEYDSWYSNVIVSYMVMFIFVFVPPMILSFEFARYKADPIIGFLGGLVLTVGIGYMTGLLPVWFIFLIGLVMFIIILTKTGVLTKPQ
jgi:hypothetical protein